MPVTKTNNGPGGPHADNIPYADYGIVPGIAQAAQAGVYAPALFTQPPFSQQDVSFAQWFTTRVHLSPLGKA